MINPCPLANGIMICVPQGESVTIECEVHGSHVIHNPVRFVL